jgi:hypothetical protein
LDSAEGEKVVRGRSIRFGSFSRKSSKKLESLFSFCSPSPLLKDGLSSKIYSVNIFADVFTGRSLPK